MRGFRDAWHLTTKREERTRENKKRGENSKMVRPSNLVARLYRQQYKSLYKAQVGVRIVNRL